MNLKEKTINILGSKNDFIRKVFFIILGSFFCSLAINVFFVPNGLLTTGVGGLSIILNKLTGFPIGLGVLIINIPLIFLGLFKLDKTFMAYTGISIILYSNIIDMTAFLTDYLVMDDLFLAAIFGAIFNGLGMGLMFKNGVCQGGFDIPATILKREYNMNIGTGLMIFNTVIISSSSIIFGSKASMYTLISMYIGYQLLDKIQTGFSLKKNLIIVSENAVELADRIMKDMGRGVTFFKGEGAYTNTEKKIIYCTITSTEIVRLKEIVEEVDPKAFFTINEAVEVLGSGFKSIRED